MRRIAVAEIAMLSVTADCVSAVGPPDPPPSLWWSVTALLRAVAGRSTEIDEAAR